MTEPQTAPSRWASLPAWSRHPAVAGLALCAIVAVSYYPALFGGFVWDDRVLTASRVIRAWSGLWKIWFSPDDIEGEGHYWPIVYTTFWLEHKLWGLDPFGYHLVNVLLYMGNVLLLWRLLRHLAVPAAWAVAAVFAVHPMHVDSVAWVIGRKDLLCGLFYMASALCWFRSTEGVGDDLPDSGNTPSSSPWRHRLFDPLRAPSRGLYLAALGLFAAAMLSKSAAVTLPVAFMIVLWWTHERVTWSDLCRMAPFFLIALGIALADLAYYRWGKEFSSDYGIAEQVLIAARALWYYAGNLLWPADLAVIGPLWDIDTGDPLAWGYVIAAVAVAVLLWFGRHRLGRGPLAGALFFVVTLSPVLGFVNYSHLGISFVADRYAYLAGIGFMAVLVGAAAHGANRLSNPLKVLASGALVAVLAVFGKLTWEQTGIYRDKLTFFSHVIAFNPKAHVIHLNLTSALKDAGRPEEALAVSRAFLEKFPASAEAHNTYGIRLLDADRLDEAASSFRRAVEIDSGYKTARQNMGETRRRQGRFEESIRWYREVLDMDPGFVMAHAGMGAALFQSGRYDEAVESLARAASLRPYALPISTFGLLGDALRRQGRYEEAVDTYRGILVTDPDYGPAHAGIAYALLGLKRYEDAVESFARAISLQPEPPTNADLHTGMGEGLQELGQTETAAEHFARALTIDPRNAKALDHLALLRFRQQRYEEALPLFQALIEVDETNAQAHVNLSATLYLLDRAEEARRSLDRARSLDPGLRTRLEGKRETPVKGP